MSELLKISSVLTEDYLSEKLSKWYNREVTYTHHQNDDISATGGSYLSDLYRIRFFGKIVTPAAGEDPEVSVKVVIKGYPKNIGRRKTFRSSDFFRNEINFYENVLPVLLNFQSEKNISDPFVSCPKLFAAASNDEDDFLALEDLGVRGYRGAVRQESIDYAHCLNILETFAKFHAISFALKDQRAEDYTKIADSVKETYFAAEFWDWYKNLYKLLCICAIDALEKECPNTIYLEKIKDFATEKTHKRVVEATHANPKSSVIGHGDSWTPNFLFKYKEGTNEPLSSMMIDYQIVRSASPVLDVAFFIYAVTSEELRDERYRDMLKFYHDVLSKQIREMGSAPEKVYSWDYFMQEVKEYSFFAVAFSLESTPVIILPEQEAFDLNSITGTDPIDIADVMNVKPIKSKEGRQRMVGIIKHAVDNGYI